MFHITVLIFLITTNAETFSLDVCSEQSISSTDVTWYEHTNGVEENCNCTRPERSCIRKCCAIGFHAINGSCKRHVDPNFVFDIPVYDGSKFVRNVSGHTGVLVGTMHCSPFLLHFKDEDWFYVQEDGSISTSVYGTMTNEYYCVDYIDGQLGALICFKSDFDFYIHNLLSAAGMIISMPFLLATIIVYALLPEKNFHMKALMFYAINLLLGFLNFVIIKLTEHGFTSEICTRLGYSSIFFLMCSFFWMNAICIDIWLAFSSLRGFSENRKDTEGKRFYIYCAYACGMPMLLVLIVFLIDAYAPDFKLGPGIGKKRCFLERGYPELFYFYGPITVLTTINIILYLITAFNIRNIKKETSVLTQNDNRRHSFDKDRQMFNLYLKLLFAMGVNWSMEIISWAALRTTEVSYWVWCPFDFCNTVYGAFIFFIFVFKKSNWKLLKTQYPFISKLHLPFSIKRTTTLTITSDSTADPSLKRRY